MCGFIISFKVQIFSVTIRQPFGIFVVFVAWLSFQMLVVASLAHSLMNSVNKREEWVVIMYPTYNTALIKAF